MTRGTHHLHKTMRLRRISISRQQLALRKPPARRSRVPSNTFVIDEAMRGGQSLSRARSSRRRREGQHGGARPPARVLVVRFARGLERHLVEERLIGSVRCASLRLELFERLLTRPSSDNRGYKHRLTSVRRALHTAALRMMRRHLVSASVASRSYSGWTALALCHVIGFAAGELTVRRKANSDRSLRRATISIGNVRGYQLLLLNSAGLCECLRLVRLDMPSAVIRGDPLWLNCSFDLESDDLYSVKWYKNHREFFRFLPSENPPGQAYRLSGVYVDAQMLHAEVLNISRRREYEFVNATPNLM
ncbi:hypothetical protein HPB51_022874 [Rhipicephalus microplus]|uniref:Ig-like domain-containing protein n=1 Tax=Rhipicephalus microplus TaxID=6941 RepID=A0A9J6DR24_RHIMP|nr:hypothetical protein HPB51_022874 [Rhipicephalus microplus]